MKLSKYIPISAMLLCMAFLFAFIVIAEKNFKNKAYLSLKVRILNNTTETLLSEENIKNRILLDPSLELGSRLNTLLLREINCYNLVKTLEKDNVYIRQARCYKTWLGNINIEVLLKNPIARFQYPQGEDKYLDEFGEVIPLSKNFSFRVPIFQINKESLQQSKNLKNSEYGTMLFSLIKHIKENLTLNAQISYSIVQSNGNIELYSQVGGQCIEFGKPENIQEKFEKLILFYKEVASYKGWNFYKRVNLEFENQIVCE